MINSVGYWRHRIDLGDGLYTHGTTMLNAYDRYGLGKAEIKGKSYLDIGAWDGYYSFKAESFGASRVLATDVWRGDSDNKKRWNTIRNEDEGIITAKKVLNSNISIQNLSVYDIVKAGIGNFDIVNFTGVIYHLRNPYLALEAISQVCKSFMVFDTTCFRFKNHNDELENIPLSTCRQNGAGWFYNEACVKEMIINTGFRKIVEVPMQVPSSDQETQAGLLGEGVKVRKYFENDECFDIDLSGEKVIVCGTEHCNMDIDNPDANWLRIQNRLLGSIQGWVPKDSVSILKKPTPVKKPTPSKHSGRFLKKRHILDSTDNLETYRYAAIVYK